MPCIRGVEVLVVRGRDPGVHKDLPSSGAHFVAFPEYPHSDSSSINLAASTQTSEQSPRECHDQQQYQKTQARASVYIPSERGLRFAFEWSIKRPDEHQHLIYFVVLFNGRRIVSWGTDPKESSTGLTEYALYEPSSNGDFSEKGVMVQKSGMEKRYFYFNSDHDDCAASHGGHIEVQVFRAKGRKLHSANPPGYRNQENWGIICPSGGLTENPQTLKYYDWDLLDHLKNPYITFRFHYRSWESLCDLNIVPSVPLAEEQSKPTSVRPDFDFATLKLSLPRRVGGGQLNPSPPINLALGSLDRDARRQHDSGRMTPYSVQSPLDLRPSSTSDPQLLPQPCKSERDLRNTQHLERPLPMLPRSMSRSSSVESRSPLPRRSRSSSGAYSIATSLASLVDDLDNDFGDGEIFTAESMNINKAQGAKIVEIKNFRCKSDGLDRPLPEPPRSSSLFRYSIPSATPESSHDPLGQDIHLLTTGNTLHSTLANLSPLGKTRSRAISDTVTSVVHATIAEAHRMQPGQRAPSPLRRRQTQTSLNLLAAAHVDAFKAKSA